MAWQDDFEWNAADGYGEDWRVEGAVGVSLPIVAKLPPPSTPDSQRGIMSLLDDPPMIGDLMRVLSSDESSGAVHGRYQNGRLGRFHVTNGDLPVRGDLILLSQDRWEFAPLDTLTDLPPIGVIKALMDDGTVLVDSGISIVRVPNNVDLNVAINNTVAYDDIDGIVEVLSEEPLRSRDYGQDQIDVAKDYLVAAPDKTAGFSEFGGYPHVIARARELIETQLDQRESLEEIGARPVKGILFTGPPGTGKTHLARIIASESRAAFFLVSGPSIVSKWVGDTEDTLRRIFEAAAASERAIIFFDEIDSIAERRTGDSHEASKRLVAQLLTLLDGFDGRGRNVVVIAATNRIESLDPALTRPGRFDWEIEFGMPDLADRIEILEVGARRLRTVGQLPIRETAALTEGWAAAELSAIWTEAALLAAADGRRRVVAEDVAQAYERVARRPRHEIKDN